MRQRHFDIDVFLNAQTEMGDRLLAGAVAVADGDLAIAKKRGRFAEFACGIDADLAADARLATNPDRVRARDWMMPILRERLSMRDADEIAQIFERHHLPFARIARPHDLFDDPHLLASGALAPIDLPADASASDMPIHTRTPLLPITLSGERFGVRTNPPSIGADSERVLQTLGYAPSEIATLAAAGVIRLPDAPATA